MTMQCATPRRGAIIGLAAVLWLAASSNALAQEEEGRIAGTVSDATTGRPIADASIELVGTQVRVATDLEGRYRTRSLAAGIYTVHASMFGYTTLRVDSVTLMPGTRALIGLGADGQTNDPSVRTVLMRIE